MTDDVPDRVLRQFGVPNTFRQTPRRISSEPVHVLLPQQLCLPGFRERPFVGVGASIRVAKWALRVLARTEARDVYLSDNHPRYSSIDALLGISEDRRPASLSAFNEWVMPRLDEVERQAEDDADVVRANIALLGSELDLTAAECELLELRSQIWTQQVLGDLFNGLFDDAWPDSKLARVLAVAVDGDLTEISRALSRDGKLNRTGLVRINPAVNQRFVGKTAMQLGLCNALLQPAECLEELLSYAVQCAPAASLTATAFPHLQAEVTAISNYLRAASRDRLVGVNILLHGPPGVGKTELARTLSQSLGLRSFEVRLRGDFGESLDLQDRLDAYQVTQALLGATGNAAVVFDEIENALPRGMFLREEKDSIKAWLNQVLETNPLPAFWIANNIGRIDPAYLRRFDMVLEVKVPPRSMRRKILRDCLGTLPVGEDWVDQQAEDPEVSPAVTARAARVLHLMGTHDPTELEATYEMLIRGQKRGAGSRAGRTRGTRIADYRPEWLDVDADVPQLIESLRRRPRGRLLFHGPPGTGKTALTHHIARTVDRPLLIKRASDLVSMWMGETEKSLCAMFEEAAVDDAVLLLDEADSFLQDRRLAVRSWEVTEVNELLTQMESFEGLFVCATNLPERLDPAALRRFSLKLGFLPLRPEQSASLFGAYYGRLAHRELTQVEVGRIAPDLARIMNLTLGDFTAAMARWELLDHTPSPAELLDALRQECAMKPGGAHTMGF